ncbi:TlpA family protein disulfide reductase [Streptodolium elevatio]|uniref:TlpA disulfide reductase family protein n=1 Tax=Streptodolium elevatio TaxID=3157996 RepID=A0ABV3DSS3_9ACTN
MLTRRPILRAAALTAVAVFVLAGCGSDGGGKEANADQQGYVEGKGIKQVAAGDRKAAPNISGKTLDGQAVSLADFKGKVVVLNVWGSWCAPCRGEAPNLAKVAADTKDKGVVFLGINTRDATETNAKRFEENFQIEYPSIWDPEGRQILKFKGDLNPAAIPSTLVIDQEGRIAARSLRAVTVDDLRMMIDPLLNGS